MQLNNIHEDIKNKLNGFIENKQVPNLIFHGSPGTGKKTILFGFLENIYKEYPDCFRKYIMNVNCAHGKGIKFIRDELKFFAKTHIHSHGGDVFKSVILLNADKLTIDAQSALRRCIELFSHNTRFFIVVEDKYKLLKPILSRFCEIFIPIPVINKKNVNLHKYVVDKQLDIKKFQTTRTNWLRKELQSIKEHVTLSKISITEDKKLSVFIILEINKIYERGYSCLDIIQFIETSNVFDITTTKKYELLFIFDKVRSELRGEKTLMLFIFNFVFLSLDYTLENITFM